MHDDALDTRPWPTDPRYIARADGVVIGPRGVPVGSRTKTGYLIVSCQRGTKRSSIGAHAIVCEAFHGPAPRPGMQAAHEDGDPSNNQPGNLSWKSPKGNNLDMLRHGTAANRLSPATVAAIRAARGTGSQRKIGAKFGVSQPTVSHILAGRTWREAA